MLGLKKDQIIKPGENSEIGSTKYETRQPTTFTTQKNEIATPDSRDRPPPGGQAMSDYSSIHIKPFPIIPKFQ